MISRLQLITIGERAQEHFCCADEALDWGAKWIQLRLKGEDDGSWCEGAKKIVARCRQQGATLIINDHIWLAREVGAHGVHLGQGDAGIAEARAELGSAAIVGISTNSAAEIQEAAAGGANYVGLGPFRATSTKQNLRPILGAEGIAEIFEDLRMHKITLPVVVIGGIQVADVLRVRELGAHGVAVAGAVFDAQNRSAAWGSFCRKLEGVAV